MAKNEGSRGEGFLARWSERKRAVRESEAAEDKAAVEAEKAQPESQSEDVLAENRAAAEAIDLESLTPATDFTPFLKAGVPAALKQAALRKLWRSDPVFACLDGLDDYREDYNDPSFLLKNGTSSWKPGTGYAERLKELEEKAREVLAEAEPEDSGVAEAGLAPQAEEQPAAEPVRAAAAAEAGDGEPEAGGEAVEDDEEAQPAPRVPLRTRLDFAAFRDEG